ncbi:MAG: AAA family ATPase [Candidatus Sericytochromatia bacterium]|nr:AAA family ATPase [Candidatus Tanganyikabacteria bacterium]
MTLLLDTLSSYVPATVARQMLARGSALEAAQQDRFPAALLLADVSGFTALTERLAREGPAGAEQLARILNEYFGHLIDLVARHGGDVFKFAGDALLVLWPGDLGHDDLASLVRRATQCALAMQEPHRLASADDQTKLSLRVSIGAGEIAVAHLGGVYDSWEYVVAGEALAAIGEVSHGAEPGHVTVTKAAAALLETVAALRPLSGGGAIVDGLRAFLPPEPRPAPVLDSQSESVLRGYLPGTVRSKVDAGQQGWLAELRRVTVVFVNLPDLDHDTPLEQAQEVVRRLQAAVYRYEGSVNKLSVDEKGISMLAAMGLPPLSHEDDAVRAVQAGVVIRDALDGLGVRFGIGVTTGQAFCGEIGNAARREYTMMGDVVNRAARLMQVAVKDGDLICDGATQQVIQHRFNLDDLGKVSLKGMSGDVEIFRPTAEIKKQDRAAKLVGRMAERGEVEMLMLELQSGGEGGVVIVEGDAGMGKSALVLFYMLQARVLGIDTLAGNADAVERNTPYFAWRPIFSHIFKMDPGAQDLAARRHAVLAVLEEDPELAPWAPLLNTLLPLEFPDNEHTAPLSGQARAARTNEFLARLLARQAERGPTMMVIEDAHWLDSASWGLLRYVCQSVRPLIAVVASRPIPDPVPAEYRQIVEAPGARRQRLGPLQPDEIELMLLRRLEVRKLPKELVGFIVARTGGHPFFSEEVTLSLRDGGYITIAGGECHLAPRVTDLASLDLPDTVQGLITSRIDRVTPAQQLTLKVASVIGRSFPLRILRAIFPIEEDKPRLQDYLEAMERLDLTPLETPPPETIYMFNHMMTHEVVYGLMLFSQRRELHQKCAEWFEDTFATDLTPYLPLLAHHWSKAEHPARAATYYERAGEQAMQTGAYLEAARFFESALATDGEAAEQARKRREAVTTDRLRRARWERLMGHAFLGAGRSIEAREQLKRALALLGSPLPDTRVGLRAEILVAGWKEALARLRGGAGAAAGTPAAAETLEIARAHGSLCEIFIQNNEPLNLRYSCLRVLNLMRRHGSSPELSRSFGFMGLLQGAARRHGRAEAYLKWAREAEAQAPDVPTRVATLLRNATYHLTHGDWRAVGDAASTATHLCDQLGDARQRAEATVIMARAALYTGDVARAQRLFADLADVSRDSGHIQPQCRGLSGQASCLLRTGAIQDALSLLEQHLHLQESNPERMALLAWHGQLALANSRAARPELAWKEAEHAERLVVETPLVYNPDPYFGLPEVYLMLLEGSPTQLPAPRRFIAQRLTRAVRRGRRLARHFAIAEPQAWLWQGHHDWLRKKPRQAFAAWQRSLDAARRLAMPYEEGLAALELGRHLPEADPERRRYLDQAIGLFNRLGSAGDEKRARAALGVDSWRTPVVR